MRSAGSRDSSIQCRGGPAAELAESHVGEAARRVHLQRGLAQIVEHVPSHGDSGEGA